MNRGEDNWERKECTGMLENLKGMSRIALLFPAVGKQVKGSKKKQHLDPYLDTEGREHGHHGVHYCEKDQVL